MEINHTSIPIRYHGHGAYPPRPPASIPRGPSPPCRADLVVAVPCTTFPRLRLARDGHTRPRRTNTQSFQAELEVDL